MKISIAKFIGYNASLYKYFVEAEFSRETLTRFCWSPCVWEGGKREKKSFLCANYAALDFDNGKWTLQDAVDVVKAQGLWAMIGTTRSHSNEKHRYRIIYKFETKITNLLTYEHNVKAMIDAMPADNACQDGARFFFPCLYIAYSQEGKPYPVNSAPSSPHPKKPSENLEYQKKFHIVPPWMRAELASGIPEGRRNKTVFRFSLHLKERGLTEDETARVLSDVVGKGFGENELIRTINSAYRYTRG